MPFPLIAAAGAQAGLGLAKSLYGLIDYKKARDEENRLKDPFYKIQNEYIQNRDIAASNAESGLPSDTKKYYTQEAQRGLGAGLGAITGAGGDVNQIASLLDVYNNDLNKIASEDALMHTKNLSEFMERNKDLAGQKNIQFAINELQPYERKLKQLQERKAADVQNTFGGISDTIGAASSFATSTINQNNFDRVLKSQNPNSPGSALSKMSYPVLNKLGPLNEIMQDSQIKAPNVPQVFDGSLESYYKITNQGVPFRRPMIFNDGRTPQSIDLTKVNWIE